MHATNFAIVRRHSLWPPAPCTLLQICYLANFYYQKDATVKHVQGQSNLTKYERKHGIATGDQMDSYFCKTCGSLMYRISSGFPHTYIMRLGAVDDFSLYDGVLKPQLEQFASDKVSWHSTAGSGIKVEMGNVIKP